MNKCSNCGKEGAHFVTPSMGQSGFFICESEEKEMSKAREFAESVQKMKSLNIYFKLKTQLTKSFFFGIGEFGDMDLDDNIVSSEDALALAAWINDTFGERNE